MAEVGKAFGGEMVEVLITYNERQEKDNIRKIGKKTICRFYNGQGKKIPIIS